MKQLLARVRALYKSQPTRVVGYTTTAIVFVASQLHLVLDPATVAQYLVIAIPVVLGIEHVKAKVSPAAADNEPA